MALFSKRRADCAPPPIAHVRHRHDYVDRLAASRLSIPNSVPPRASTIRLCRVEERPEILAIVNAAAERYRSAIPADCWHEPYMSADQLEHDITAGVTFWGCEDDFDVLCGVMGIQQVRDVSLIRHAYVRPDQQGRGVGGALLRHLENLSPRQILIGTWADAAWAIRFYQNHGYSLVPSVDTAQLLKAYWTISPRQVETSVVLAKPSIPHRNDMRAAGTPHSDV